MYDPHPYYPKSHTNERMWLDDSVKQFYIVSAYKLNLKNNYKFKIVNALVELRVYLNSYEFTEEFVCLFLDDRILPIKSLRGCLD